MASRFVCVVALLLLISTANYQQASATTCLDVCATVTTCGLLYLNPLLGSTCCTAYKNACDLAIAANLDIKLCVPLIGCSPAKLCANLLVCGLVDLHATICLSK